MISKEGRFIFFHIPRTGGKAIQDCLWGGYTDTKTGIHYSDNPDFYGPYKGKSSWHAHGFSHDYIGESVGEISDHIGQEIYDWNINFLGTFPGAAGNIKFEEYFKFAFVRNPWDRFISLWVKFKEEELLQMQFNTFFGLHPDYDFKDPGELLKFLLITHRKGLLLPRWFKPQYEYVHDARPQVLTNYVGMYEKLQFCFDFLCDRIDVPHKILPWSGEEHRRKKKDGKYYTEWYDDIMISAIAEIYHHDIRTWGYEFGD